MVYCITTIMLTVNRVIVKHKIYINICYSFISDSIRNICNRKFNYLSLSIFPDCVTITVLKARGHREIFLPATAYDVTKPTQLANVRPKTLKLPDVIICMNFFTASMQWASISAIQCVNSCAAVIIKAYLLLLNYSSLFDM